MAKYMAKVQGFIEDVLRNPGEVFEYEGKMPGKWMMLLEGEAPAAEKPKASSAKTPKAKAEGKPSARANDQSVI